MEPLPYRWDVRGDNVAITVSYGALDATSHCPADAWPLRGVVRGIG